MAVADIDLTDRIARLERKYRFAVVTAGVSALCAVVGLAGNMADRAVAAPAAAGGKAVTDVLRVRELNVVDPNGVTRVKIAAPLPNAVIDGRTLTRGGRPEDTVSGMLLFDAVEGDGGHFSIYLSTSVHTSLTAAGLPLPCCEQ